jgi:hypothetical protein
MAKEFLFPTNAYDVLDDNDVTESKIASNAVTAPKLAADAVTTAKIADDAVTAAKVDLAGVSGTFTFTADKLEVSGTPTSANAVPNKSYVDSVAAGLADVKNSCRVATTGSLLATRASNVVTADANGSINTAGIDGVTTLALNDRVLLKNQQNPIDNGIYTITDLGSGGTPWVLTRATDADSSSEVTPGMFTFIEEGTQNGDTGWLLTSDAPIVLNTDDLVFTQFSSAGVIQAGDGLTKTGNTLDVVAGNGIVVNANDVAVDYGTTAELADVDKSAESAGVSNKVARADHKHDISTGTPSDVGTANGEGVAASLARSDHVHAHGTHTDGTNHAAATDSTSGFMTATQFQRVAMLRKGEATTVDLTVTALVSHLMSAYSGVVIRATIIGYNDSDDTSTASYELVAEFFRGNGAASQKGSTTVVRQREDTAGWNADIALNGNTIEVQVTGQLATSIKWGCIAELVEVLGGP